MNGLGIFQALPNQVYYLWAARWRRHEATGDMILMRYADDIVVGFEHEADARRFWDDMRKRFEDVSEGSLSRSSTSFGMHGGRKAHPRTHRIDGAIGIAAEVIANL